jgi:cytochrome c
VKIEAALLACLLTATAAARADETGARLFEHCRACHSLDPAERGLPGPNLSGLLKRKVGDDGAFDYSPVLRKARDDGITWDEARLNKFLADPAEMFPGLWMATRGLDDATERSALVRFLADPSSR